MEVTTNLQGHHTAPHGHLALLPFLDLRVVVPARIRTVSQSCRRKQAKEEEASKEERQQRGRQGGVTAEGTRGEQEAATAPRGPCP